MLRIKKFFTWIAGCVIAAASMSAHASLDDQMRDIFGSMVNVTNPAAYDGQTRGGVSGGTLFVRNAVMKPNIIAFKPPSMSAGCGGINIFGGSFSFINANQIKTLLNNIASNAVGYSFQLAIDAICPTCGDNMKALAAKIQQMNDRLGSSCEMAQSLVKGIGGDTAKDFLRKHASIDQAAAGVVESVSAGVDWLSLGTPNPSKTQKTREDTANLHNSDRSTESNVVWDALLSGQVANWFNSGGGYGSPTELGLYEAIMNFTGSVVYFTDQSAPDNEAEKTKLIIPKIGFMEFLYGAPNKEVWICDEYVDCMTPGPANRNIRGIYPMVRELIYGGGADGSPGILAKIREKGASSLTAQERQLIETMSPGIMGLLRNFASDTRSAQIVADQFVHVVASEMAISLTADMITAIQHAIAENAVLKTEKVTNLVSDARSRLRDVRQSTEMTAQGITGMFELAQHVRSNLIGTLRNDVPTRIN